MISLKQIFIFNIMKLRKLLILGSDYGTIDMVREAHKAGLYVVVTDTMETSPTKEEADEKWLISTTDIDALEKKCREEDISAVTFGASDFNITNGRILCKRLGLPIYCDSDRAWEVARNKSEFKKLCREVGAPIATDYYLTDKLSRDELDKIQYPVVVKPVDKSGNRGMSYCMNEEELIVAYRYARSVSDNATIIVEHMMKGPVFAVDYVLADGESSLLYYLSEHHQPGQLKNLYSIYNTTSAFFKQYVNELDEAVRAVIKKAECREGIVWVECMRDIDGHFYLLEMGYRYGGEMTYVPYELMHGFNTIKWMLDVALGVKHKKSDLPAELNVCYQSCAASYFLFSTCDGEIALMEGVKEVEEMENVTIDFPKRLGSSVRYHTAFGIIRLYAKDCDEMCKIISNINNVLKIRDKDGKDMFIYFDDFDTIRTEYAQGLREFGINI